MGYIMKRFPRAREGLGKDRRIKADPRRKPKSFFREKNSVKKYFLIKFS